jgi:hypothetical protein
MTETAPSSGLHEQLARWVEAGPIGAGRQRGSRQPKAHGQGGSRRLVQKIGGDPECHGPAAHPAPAASCAHPGKAPRCHNHPGNIGCPCACDLGGCRLAPAGSPCNHEDGTTMVAGGWRCETGTC